MNATAPISTGEQGSLGDTLVDGSLVIRPEQLKRLGHGDVASGRRNLRIIVSSETDRPVPTKPAERPQNVRLGTAADEPAVFELIMSDLKENAEKIAPIAPWRVVETIRASLDRTKGNILGIIDGPDKKPVAIVILMLNQWWWSQAYYLQDQIMYVHPDHRKERHIETLQKFAMWVTDSWTAGFGYRMYMLTGVLGTRQIRRKAMLFRRKFGRMVGMAFLYPPVQDGEE